MFLYQSWPDLQTVPDIHQRGILWSSPQFFIYIHFVDVVVNVAEEEEGEGDGDNETEQDDDAEDAGYDVEWELFGAKTDEARDSEKYCSHSSDYHDYRSWEKIRRNKS